MPKSSFPVTRSLFDEVMMPNYAPASVIPVRGEGSRVWDQDDKEYIDFAGGIAVTSLGHCHPKVVKALTDQGNKLWHLSNVLTNEPALRLARKLVDLTFADKVFFSNSGAEANEAALKLARRYAFDHFGSEKNEIISFQNSFHGRTLFTVTAGGQPKYCEGFSPVPEGITHLPYNDLDSLKAAISEKTCAIIMEPIIGEGGIIPATQSFIEGARELCDQHNALLIFDEVQTGAGRTGALYAYMNYGVAPDILTSAKGLGGGFPIGATLAKKKIAESFIVGTHGSTFGGNPLACAVAEAVLDEISQPDLLAAIATKRQLFIDGIEAINRIYPFFQDIRGEGLLMGIELIPAWHGKAREFLKAAMKEQLMLLVAGPNVLRFTPSLVIQDKDIKEGMKRLERVVAKLTSPQVKENV